MEKGKTYVNNLIKKMTLDQKIGGLLTLGFAGTIPRGHIYEYITKYHCGGLRLSPTIRKFGNYVDPLTGETIVNVENEDGLKDIPAPYLTASDYKEVLLDLQRVAKNRPLGIPLHFSYDQEGGTSADYNFGGVEIFPKPMGLRATGDKKLAYDVAKATAKQGRAVGFNWMHSPVLDININPNNPEIYTRAYSDRVEDVIEYARETCKGLKEEKMIATGKHFPGRGDSAVDAHYKLPVIDIDKETLLKRELLPYKVLIKEDLLPSIMIAHSIFPAIDSNNVATVSKKVVTGLLREELGFEGVIATDSMTMGALATRYGVSNACAMALEAGCDLILMKAENNLVEETFNKIKEYIQNGRISLEDLDKKIYRVLSTKYDFGLFSEDENLSVIPEEVSRTAYIKELSQEVAKRSTLILRNEKSSLPLDNTSKVLVIEQINKQPNDKYWHPGLLYKHCMQYTMHCNYFETQYTMTQEDKDKIQGLVKKYDTLVITNFYIRGKQSNTEFIDALCKITDKKIIVITNTPYPLSIPKQAKNVILTFATSPENIKITADILFGKAHAEGEWPIGYKMEEQK